MLVDRVEHSNGIVYVEFGYCAFGHLNACVLPLIASPRGDRYLRILVTSDKTRRSHDQLLALIAHELRHALEVFDDRDVVDVATMTAMYKRIGTPETGGLNGTESAARAAGDHTLNELLTGRKAAVEVEKDPVGARWRCSPLVKSRRCRGSCVPPSDPTTSRPTWRATSRRAIQ